MTDLEIYRAAKLLIDQHGERAVFHAMDRARDLAERDEEADAVTWIRIAKAVRELARERRPEEMVH